MFGANTLAMDWSRLKNKQIGACGAILVAVAGWFTPVATAMPALQIAPSVSPTNQFYHFDTSVALTPALDMYEAWRLALSHDANYQAARSRFAASQAQKDISRAGLFPHLQASYSDRRVTGWRERPGALGLISRSDLDYDSTHLTVQLRQPLLNYPKWAEYRRGIAVAQQGVAQLGIDQQETALQLARSYFDVLLAAIDTQEQQQRVQFLVQRVQAFERMHHNHDATRVDLADTQARLATAQAQALKAQHQLRLAARQLQAQIGMAPAALLSVAQGVVALPLETELSVLQQQARQLNRELQAAKQQIQIAQSRLDNARSQYFPSLDLVASYSKGDSEDLTTLSQRTNTYSIGVQLRIPIFTGGYTTAITTQARYERQQAEQLYRRAIEQVNTQVAKLYQQYRSGRDNIAAHEQAVRSSELSLDSARKSFTAGAAANLDVLDALDQLSTARYDYYKTVFSTLMARIELGIMVGTPISELMHDLAWHYFSSSTSPVVVLPTGLAFRTHQAFTFSN